MKRKRTKRKRAPCKKIVRIRTSKIIRRRTKFPKDHVVVDGGSYYYYVSIYQYSRKPYLMTKDDAIRLKIKLIKLFTQQFYIKKYDGKI